LPAEFHLAFRPGVCKAHQHFQRLEYKQNPSGIINAFLTLSAVTKW
jgi:hypothetical protein